MAYKMKMYDPSGKLVEVDRNQLDELLGQGYSFMRPKTKTPVSTSGNIVGATEVMPEPSRSNIAAPTLKNLGYITGEFEYDPLTGTYTDTMTDHATGVTTTDQGRVRDPYADMLAEIERRQRELAEAQRQSRIAALQKSKETALANLESGLTSAMSAYAGEEAVLKPYYYDLRNRAAAQSDIAAKNFAEYMAAQGIRGSAAGLPEIYRNAALQGQIGALTRQEQQAREDIARRRSATQAEYETQKAGLLNAYESDVAAAMADIDAQTLQNYIDNMRIIQAQRVADLAAQGKTSTGELTLQGREAQQNELARQAALLAAQYYDDIQAYINTLDPNDPLVPYLYAERRKKIQTEAEKAAAAAAAASEEEQRAWKRAFDLFQSTGRITSAEQAQILGLPMDATVADVDIARMNAATSRMNAETARMNAQKSGQAKEEPEPGSIGSLLGAKGVLNEARAMKEEAESDIAVIDYVVKSGLPIEDITAVLSALGYTNEDIDMYEAATRETAYMGEFQRWFNR
jgi:hypothetical protein